MKTEDEQNDPLTDQLHNEAMAERPAFSPDLHDQILNRFRDERFKIQPPRSSRFKRPLLLATAAAIAIVSGVAIIQFSRNSSRSSPVPPIAIAQNDSHPSVDRVGPSIPPRHRLPMSANVGGILSATLWPPQVTLHLSLDPPLAERAPEPPAKPPSRPPLVPGSPEWLLAGLQQPTLDAKTALIDLIPPEFQRLFDMAMRER